MDKNINNSCKGGLMDKKIFTIILLGILLFSPVLALDEMKPAELNKQYTILQGCKNSTYVNITVSNKNDVVITNQPMTSNGSSNYVYSFTPSQVGRYDVNGVCDVNGIAEPFATSFEVTGSGLTSSIGFYLLLILLSFGVITLGFYTHDATITVLGTFGLYFFGLYVLFYGLGGIKDPVYTWAMGIITLMTAAYISWKALSEAYLS